MRSIGYVDYDPQAAGISQLSLTRLRNVLVEKFNIRMVVVRIPTDEGVYGYLIVSKTLRYACWTGDGFREDKCGEGGTPAKTADSLLTIFGIHPLQYHEAVDLSEGHKLIADGEGHKGRQLLKHIFQRVVDEVVVEDDFERSCDHKAGNVR